MLAYLEYQFIIIVEIGPKKMTLATDIIFPKISSKYIFFKLGHDPNEDNK